MIDNYHNLLKRQLKKHFKERNAPPSDYDTFLNAVNVAYRQADEERLMMERSLEISSQELLEKNSQVRAMFQVFPDVILRINFEGEILDYKPASEDSAYQYPEKMIGEKIYQVLGDVIGKKYKEGMDGVIREKKLVTIEYGQKQKDQMYYFESRLQPLMDNQMIVIIRNFTTYKRTLEAFRKSEERYALSADGAHDGLWDWDLKTNTIYFSPRWKAMLGFKELDISDDPEEWFSRIHEDDIQRVKRAVEAHKDASTPHLEVEYQIQHQDGTYLWMLTRGIAVADKNGEVYRMAGSQTDITNRKQIEDQLRHDALHDRLTSLPNRALFMDRLETLNERVKRHPGYLFAILFIDLDRFKVVNDSLGHLMGDELLIEVSKRLKTCLRTVDTVARMGGDEFTILLDEITSARDAIFAAERIQEKIAEPILIGDQELYVTASIGITINSEGVQTAEELLRDADTAMYRAKNQGKAGHEVFDADMHQKAMDRLHVESDMRRAIERNEFEVYYQPIISLKENKVVRMEALLRWNHPQQGIIFPVDFIPVAEETGMIVPIGAWVMYTVCMQCNVWQKMGFKDLEMSINVSARQFEDKDLTDIIQKIIKETGVSAIMLEIEITESIAMKDIEYSINVLNQLKSFGLKIAIDDFGIGYSSFSCLKYFPIDALKIDRTFIKDLPQNQDSLAITKAIIALGHSLELKVTAEGVETEEQLEFLRQQDCNAVQGYYYAKPVPAKEATAFLKGFKG